MSRHAKSLGCQDPVSQRFVPSNLSYQIVYSQTRRVQSPVNRGDVSDAKTLLSPQICANVWGSILGLRFHFLACNSNRIPIFVTRLRIFVFAPLAGICYGYRIVLVLNFSRSLARRHFHHLLTLHHSDKSHHDKLSIDQRTVATVGQDVCEWQASRRYPSLYTTASKIRSSEQVCRD